MQDRGDTLRLPIAEQAAHVLERRGFTLDEYGLVTDRLLLLVDRADLRVHDLGADLHVSDRVIAVRLRVALPDRDRMRHQLAHRRLVIIVAHHAAGDARRAGADAGLVEDDDAVRTLADGHALGAQASGKVHCGRKAVDAGADDDVRGVGRKRRHGTPGWVRRSSSWLAGCTPALDTAQASACANTRRV